MTQIICINDIPNNLSTKDYVLSKIGTKEYINIIEIPHDDNKENYMKEFNNIMLPVLSNIIYEYAVPTHTLSLRIESDEEQNNALHVRCYYLHSDIYQFVYEVPILTCVINCTYISNFEILNCVYYSQYANIDRTLICKWLTTLK